MKFRNREIGYYNDRIALNFDISVALSKTESHEILSKASVRLANRGTGFSSLDIDPIAWNYPVSAPGHLIYHLSEYIIHQILKRNSECLFPSFIRLHGMNNMENNVCNRVTNSFSAHERVMLGLFPELRSNEGKNIKITLELAQKQFVARVHILFFFLHDIRNPWMTIKRRSLHIVPASHTFDFVLLMTSQSIADDVTMTRQLWCDYLNSDI